MPGTQLHGNSKILCSCRIDTEHAHTRTDTHVSTHILKMVQSRLANTSSTATFGRLALPDSFCSTSAHRRCCSFCARLTSFCKECPPATATPPVKMAACGNLATSGCVALPTSRWCSRKLLQALNKPCLTHAKRRDAISTYRKGSLLCRRQLL